MKVVAAGDGGSYRRRSTGDGAVFALAGGAAAFFAEIEATIAAKGKGEPTLECVQCSGSYLESANHARACAFHPGRLRGDWRGCEFTCCKKEAVNEVAAQQIVGCTAGEHRANPHRDYPYQRYHNWALNQFKRSKESWITVTRPDFKDDADKTIGVGIMDDGSLYVYFQYLNYMDFFSAFTPADLAALNSAHNKAQESSPEPPPPPTGDGKTPAPPAPPSKAELVRTIWKVHHPELGWIMEAFWEFDTPYVFSVKVSVRASHDETPTTLKASFDPVNMRLAGVEELEAPELTLSSPRGSIISDSSVASLPPDPVPSSTSSPPPSSSGDPPAPPAPVPPSGSSSKEPSPSKSRSSTSSKKKPSSRHSSRNRGRVAKGPQPPIMPHADSEIPPTVRTGPVIQDATADRTAMSHAAVGPAPVSLRLVKFIEADMTISSSVEENSNLFHHYLSLTNTTKEPLVLESALGQFQIDGSWKDAAQTRAGTTDGWKKNYVNTLPMTLAANETKELLLTLSMTFRGRSGADALRRWRAHPSLPNPTNMRFTLAFAGDSPVTKSMVTQHVNPPLNLQTLVAYERKIKKNLMFWLQADDADALERTFVAVKLDDGAARGSKAGITMEHSSGSSSTTHTFTREEMDAAAADMVKLSQSSTTLKPLSSEKDSKGRSVTIGAILDKERARLLAFTVSLTTATSSASGAFYVPWEDVYRL